MKLHNNLSVVYQTEILDAKTGQVLRKNPPKNNLLLDVGLNGLVGRTMYGAFSNLVLGDGTTPTKRDSGVVTVAINAGLATSSAGFFEAGDVGRLIKLDSGQEAYISAVNSATEAVLSDSVNDAASPFTIWYVNETQHGNELVRVGASDTPASVWDGTTMTHTRIFTGAEETEARTYTEIGWSSGGSSASHLFGRDLIPNGGDSIFPGQKYRVTVKLIVNPGSTTPQRVDGKGDGTTFDGQGIMVSTRSALSSDAYSNSAMEPYCPSRIIMLSSQSAVPVAPSGGYVTYANLGSKAVVEEAYVANSFELFVYIEFETDEGNVTFNSFGLYDFRPGYWHFLDAPFTKADTHKLKLRFRISWGRELTN